MRLFPLLLQNKLVDHGFIFKLLIHQNKGEKLPSDRVLEEEF